VLFRSTHFGEGHMSETTDWVAVMRRLGEDFAKRSAAHDEDDSFVAENYVALKEAGAFAAGVPAELGGGGASHAELCAMLRELARHCSSTALAFSMHTHPIAAQAYSWRAGNKAPEGLLRRVAAEKIICATSGGSDWLHGSGKLEKVEGGYRLTARKVFGSGGPGADLLLTMGIYDDPKDGPTIIHLPVPLKAEGVKILDTWKTLGMRGTGSHDISLEGVFIPDAAAGGLRRTPGKWHPFMHVVVLIALPAVYAAYLGAAESAREIALKLAVRRKDDPTMPILIGELEREITTARIVHADMVQMAATAKAGPETTSEMCTRRGILGAALLRAVDRAMEVGGGAGFYRSAGLERLFRDMQASRYHPLPEKTQLRFTGRFLLGLDIDG
jgi:alkylation response protein AidB-like acyl-CoA dehydrogenase